MPNENMFMQGIDLHANRRVYDRHVDFWLFQWLPDGKTQGRATRIEFEKFPEGVAVEPSFRLAEKDTQRLFDELWDQGFRPRNAELERGQLQATQAHLQDMRAIAESRLKITLPQLQKPTQP